MGEVSVAASPAHVGQRIFTAARQVHSESAWSPLPATADVSLLVHSKCGMFTAMWQVHSMTAPPRHMKHVSLAL